MTSGGRPVSAVIGRVATSRLRLRSWYDGALAVMVTTNTAEMSEAHKRPPVSGEHRPREKCRVWNGGLVATGSGVASPEFIFG